MTADTEPTTGTAADTALTTGTAADTALTTDNIALISASYDAFRRGDLDAALAFFDPDIEWVHPDGMDDHGLGGVERGLPAVKAFMARARALFAEVGMRPDTFFAEGDQVVVTGVNHMRAATTGREADITVVHHWRIRDGKAVRFEDIHDTAAIRALVEPAVDPAIEPWQVIRTGFRFWESRVLMSAIELGLFEALADGPRPVERIVRELGLHERGVRPFLDALTGLGMLAREDGGAYGLTPVAKRFLTEAEGTNVAGLPLAASHLWWESWKGLTEMLRTGLPQNKANAGDDPFEALYADPERVRAFHAAMAGGATGAALALARESDLDWDAVKTVADVGAAGGAVLRTLLTAHPHLAGIGFDLPQVRPHFERAAREAGLADRMRFEGGSFFTDDLPAADLLVLGHVLCDWDTATKRDLLAKAYKALPAGGAVVVYDLMTDPGRPDGAANLFGHLADLHMMLESPGGHGYRPADAAAWLAEAGFGRVSVRPLSGPEWLAVGFKD
ncbi:methyltransferase [Actinomadura rupiterrae]|uniref:methyltransferase n=1 Tax=Actinomadura rupiterrae TaxID=559627 RepID=UPI0020A5844C|nr:methyltransferase [Actinomadura rupiterrae]MCP2338099.1 ketosteroid isomerase-like protein [Actinomadura rupiterrae]MCP2340764.1 ketosteroid isomerase-like protein [Actinomadura rupiterrae]